MAGKKGEGRKMAGNMQVYGKVSKCKFCNSPILWVQSKRTKKWYAVNAEWHYPNDPPDIQVGNKTHYHTCTSPREKEK